MNTDPRIKTIAAHYGLDHQLKKTKEELRELLDAIDEHQVLYSVKSTEHLVEEIADVQIMLDQIIHLTYREELLAVFRNFKLDRQLQRIKDETHNG